MRAAAELDRHGKTPFHAGAVAHAPALVVLLLGALALAGCAAPGGPGGPKPTCLENPSLAACMDDPAATDDDTSDLAGLYRHRLLTDVARQKADHMARLAGPERADRRVSPYAYAYMRQKALVRKLTRTPEPNAAIATADTTAGTAPGAPLAEKTLDTPWRIARRTLYLAAPAHDGETSTVALGDLDAAALDLTFVLPKAPDRQAPAPATLTGACNGPVEVRTGGAVLPRSANAAFTGRVVPRGSAFTLRLSPAATRCRIAVRHAGGTARRILRLERTGKDGFAALDRRYTACVIPRADHLSATARAFFEANTPSASCVLPASRIDPLETPREGFQAKVEALLGRRLPDSFVARQDPFAPISLAGAPRLQAILVSSLMMKSDFSGQVIGRLLAFHADRGTPVRIFVAAPQTRPKDRAFLEQLSAAHPNIALDILRWQAPPGSGIGDRLSVLHRVQHIKVLVTLGPRDKDNTVILGGRNIHDAYLFKEPTKLGRWPALNQYRKGYGSLNPFVYYRDFELRLTGRRIAESFATQIGTVWNRDAETFLARRPATILRDTRQIEPSEIAGRTLVRQVVSVPYADGDALETLFVKLFDSAQHRIDIVTPYINPPRAIEAAIDRAVARGVAVRIVTRTELKGDLAGEILSYVNQRFINRHFGKITIRENTEDGAVLHAKLITIDDDLAIAGSVNLNRRSFRHDTENVLLILGKRQTARLRAAIDRLDKPSHTVTGRHHVPVLWRAILDIPAINNVF